jgi:hypothetical protein
VRLDAGAVARLRRSWLPQGHLRVTPMRHAATPLGLGHGETRFASPTKAFRVLYIGSTLTTAVAETIVRDRFVQRRRRRLTQEEIEDWGVAEVAAMVPIPLLDLRASGPVELGVPTDVVRAKSHRMGRRFSEALYAQFPDICGVIYSSRFTERTCVAVYDRAVPFLTASAVRPLILHPGFIPSLRSPAIKVIAR